MRKPERQQHQQQRAAGDQRDDGGVEQQAAREGAQHFECREVVEVLKVDEKQADPRQKENQQGEREDRQDATVWSVHGAFAKSRYKLDYIRNGAGLDRQVERRFRAGKSVMIATLDRSGRLKQ